MVSNKEKILNKIEGKFEVIEIKRLGDEDICILCKFLCKGQEGTFTYVLEGRERGIYKIKDYQEKGDEDIYGLIQDWVEEHIDWTTIIKFDDKEVEY